MLPAISDFLKSTLDENLKKFVQPSGLIPAAIFLLLNLLLIFLPLAELNHPAATWLYTFSDPWKIVVGVAVLLLLGYLLATLVNSTLKFMSGETWAESPIIGRFMTDHHRARRKWMEDQVDKYYKRHKKLKAKVAHQIEEVNRLEENIRRTGAGIAAIKNSAVSNDDELKAKEDLVESDREKIKELESKLAGIEAKRKQAELDWTGAEREKTISFPDQEFVAPTALGNVLNVTSDYIWNRYKIELVALWATMDISMADDKPLATRIDGEKAALDSMLNLALVLGLFAFEYLWLHLWLKQILPALGAFVFLTIAYGLYRAGVSKARTWGDAVQSAFDLHREDLRKKLRLREFKSFKDERAVWKRLGEWILWGKVSVDDLFYPLRKSLNWQCSENIKATVDSVVSENVRIPRGGAARKVVWSPSIRYVVAVDSMQPANVNDSANGAYVLIADDRVPSIEDKPVIENAAQLAGIRFSCSILPTGDADSMHRLLWTIGKLPPRSSRVLQYTLQGEPVFWASIASAAPARRWLKLQETILDDGYILEIINTGTGAIDQAEIQVCDDKADKKFRLKGKLSSANQPDRAVTSTFDAKTGVQTWELYDLNLRGSGTLRLEYHRKPK